jgi:hypothetical protein
LTKMKNISSTYKFIIITVVFFLACGGPVAKPGKDPYNRLKAESKFDPLSGAQDKVVITGKHASRTQTEKVGDADSLLLAQAQMAQTADSDTLANLFRVQIYISKSVDETEQYAASIKELFPEGVFVEYQPPYYKVRVGEFRKAADGELFLEHVKQLGFENAWLVRVIK